MALVKRVQRVVGLVGDAVCKIPVRNDNLDVPKSQNMEPESNPGQTILRTARLIGWEHNNPLLIKEVATSLPGPKPLAVPQDSASKLPVQDAENSPKVPTPDTSSLPDEIDKSPPWELFQTLPKSQGRH
ncbi:hypothetical protein DSO57_1000757 [Entomophthora muscae]|uniref:Uncharacterized protein n=1 Tax=Entomophthora muscae TaxID=34485 RepID=A0ACC2T972_9FUNG|nr:hypothetical protein DSO57_1000757 [Entomophthora muscae]